MKPPKIDNIQYTWQSYYDALCEKLGGVYGDNMDLLRKEFKNFLEWKENGYNIKKGEKSQIFCKNRGPIFMSWQLQPMYGGMSFNSMVEEDLGNDVAYYS